MPIEYINRRGDIYCLHKKKTKTGKDNYFFSMKKDGMLVYSLPTGYEIYENPNARVFLRKIVPKAITDEEVAIVEEGTKRFSGVDSIKIDVKGNSIVIFLPDQNINGIKRNFAIYGHIIESKLDKTLRSILTYTPMIRFVLVDEKKRQFNVERFCFRGSVDDWIFLDSSNEIEKLVEKYCKHLGEESFYELF